MRGRAGCQGPVINVVVYGRPIVTKRPKVSFHRGEGVPHRAQPLKDFLRQQQELLPHFLGHPEGFSDITFRKSTSEGQEGAFFDLVIVLPCREALAHERAKGEFFPQVKRVPPAPG